MTGISLVLIVRDEEETLGRLLPSVRPHVDEIVAIDTGSDDDTIALLERFGARVIEKPWDDHYADARNAGLDEASEDWILVLDADEAIEDSALSRLRSLAEAAPEHVGGFVFDVRNFTNDVCHLDWRACDTNERQTYDREGYIPSQVTRLFRNDDRLRYRGRVHELIEPSLDDAGLELCAATITIDHVLRFEIEKRPYYRRLLELKVAENPDSAKAHWELGQALIADGELPRALAALGRAWELAPENVEVGLHFAVGLNHAGRPNETLGVIRAIRDETKIDPRIEFQAGIALARLEAFDAARTAFSNAHVSGARFPQALYWLALLTAIDSGTEAIGVVETLLAGTPDYWPARLLRSRLLAAEGETEVAQRDLSLAIELGGGADEFLVEFGTYLGQLGEHPEYLAEVLDGLRRDSETALLVAHSLQAVGDHAGAAGFLETADVDTRSHDLIRATTLIDQGEDARAREILEPLTSDPEIGCDVQYELARSWISAQELDRAAEVLEALLEEDPSHVRAIIDLAGLHGNAGRREIAVQLLEAAGRLDPSNPLIEHNLAIAAMLQFPANPEKAEQHQARARALGQPEDPTLSTAIARARN